MKTRKINTYILFTVVFQKGRFEKKLQLQITKSITANQSNHCTYTWSLQKKMAGWPKTFQKNHNTFYTLVGVLNTSNSSGADYMSLCFNSC